MKILNNPICPSPTQCTPPIFLKHDAYPPHILQSRAPSKQKYCTSCLWSWTSYSWSHSNPWALPSIGYFPHWSGLCKFFVAGSCPPFEKVRLHALYKFCFKLADYVLVPSRYVLRNVHRIRLLPEDEQRGTCVLELFLGCGKLLIVRDVLSIAVTLDVNISQAWLEATNTGRWPSSLLGWLKLFRRHAIPNPWIHPRGWMGSTLPIACLRSFSWCCDKWCVYQWEVPCEGL
jgi:hypothetical protein